MSAAGEFDEAASVAAPDETAKPAIETKRSLIERLSTKPAMRLFVGFGIVGAFILMYPVIVACAIVGWITVAEAKELVQLLIIPATLAGTVVGYLFGREV